MSFIHKSSKKIIPILLIALVSSIVLISIPQSEAVSTAPIHPKVPADAGTFDTWTHVPSEDDKASTLQDDDGDDSYNVRMSNSKAQTYVFPSPGIPDDVGVNSVTIVGLFKRIETQVSEVAFIAETGKPNKQQFVSSPVDVPFEGTADPDRTLSGYYVRNFTWFDNPKTGVAWTEDEVNGDGTDGFIVQNKQMAFGSINRSNQNSDIHMTELYLLVDWVDNSPPVVTHEITAGTPGLLGWWTSDVTIEWTISEPQSFDTMTLVDCGNAGTPVSETTLGTEIFSTETDDSGSSPDDPSCSATSEGGNTVDSVNIKLDTRAPNSN